MNTATANLAAVPITATEATAPLMKDMLQEGIYLLFLLRSGNVPTNKQVS